MTQGEICFEACILVEDILVRLVHLVEENGVIGEVLGSIFWVTVWSLPFLICCSWVSFSIQIRWLSIMINVLKLVAHVILMLSLLSAISQVNRTCKYHWAYLADDVACSTWSMTDGNSKSKRVWSRYCSSCSSAGDTPVELWCDYENRTPKRWEFNVSSVSCAIIFCWSGQLFQWGHLIAGGMVEMVGALCYCLKNN